MWVCERCGEQFDLRQDYKIHQQDHMFGRVEDKTVEELVGGQDIVAEPIVEPMEAVEASLGKPGPTATGKEIESRPWNKEPPAEERKKQGIKLEYKYTGYCPECGTAPETLELDGVVIDSTKVVVVAWCGKCKKKLRQRQVINLYPSKKIDVKAKDDGAGKK